MVWDQKWKVTRVHSSLDGHFNLADFNPLMRYDHPFCAKVVHFGLDHSVWANYKANHFYYKTEMSDYPMSMLDLYLLFSVFFKFFTKECFFLNLKEIYSLFEYAKRQKRRLLWLWPDSLMSLTVDVKLVNVKSDLLSEVSIHNLPFFFLFVFSLNLDFENGQWALLESYC